MAAKTGAWLSLVERLVRDQEVAGSNPVAPTDSLNKSVRVFVLWEICNKEMI